MLARWSGLAARDRRRLIRTRPKPPQPPVALQPPRPRSASAAHSPASAPRLSSPSRRQTARSANTATSSASSRSTRRRARARAARARNPNAIHARACPSQEPAGLGRRRTGQRTGRTNACRDAGVVEQERVVCRTWRVHAGFEKGESVATGPPCRVGRRTRAAAEATTTSSRSTKTRLASKSRTSSGRCTTSDACSTAARSLGGVADSLRPGASRPSRWRRAWGNRPSSD